MMQLFMNKTVNKYENRSDIISPQRVGSISTPTQKPNPNARVASSRPHSSDSSWGGPHPPNHVNGGARAADGEQPRVLEVKGHRKRQQRAPQDPADTWRREKGDAIIENVESPGTSSKFHFLNWKGQNAPIFMWDPLMGRWVGARYYWMDYFAFTLRWHVAS